MKVAERLFSNAPSSGHNSGLKSLVARFLSQEKPCLPTQIRVRSKQAAFGSAPAPVSGHPPARHPDAPTPGRIDASQADLTVPVEMLRASAELTDEDFSFDPEREAGGQPPPAAAGPRLAAEARAPSAASAAPGSAARPTMPAPGSALAAEPRDPYPVSPVPPALASSFARERARKQLFQKIAVKPAYMIGGGLICILAGASFFVNTSLLRQPHPPAPQISTPAAGETSGDQQQTPPTTIQAVVAKAVLAAGATAEAKTEGTAAAAQTVPGEKTPVRVPASFEEKQTPGRPVAHNAPAQDQESNPPPQAQAAMTAPLQSIEYLLYSGSACEQKRDYAGALSCYKKAAALQPAEYRLQNKVGSLLLSLALYADAQPYIARALELNEHYTPALINMGVVHAKLENYGAAERFFASALAQDGTNIDALYNMMLVCRKKGLYAQAAAYAEKLTALGSAPPQK